MDCIFIIKRKQLKYWSDIRAIGGTVGPDKNGHEDLDIAGVAETHKYVKTGNKNATEASFLLGYRIDLAGKPHTIAENLFEPCMIQTVKCVLGEDAFKKVAVLAVKYPNNTISDRANKIPEDPLEMN